MTTRPLDQAASVLLGNPFEHSREILTAARRALQAGPAAAELDKLIRSKEIDAARDLVLALGHAQAMQSEDPAEVLGEEVLPAALARKLPRPRSAYLRLVMAAGRCFRTLARIRGSSPPMRRVRRDTWSACFGDSLRHALELERVIRDHDVLILGETGTGKETLAHAIQSATPGDDSGQPAPASAINAAAIPDTLVESELFGHVKGAFTGADEARAGRLRTADGGSFFLDEVGDLPTTTQVKLLRVIETNEVFPVGADASHDVDVRYIAATHKDLAGLVTENQFRRDLYERLAGNILRIPPLRDRPEDIAEIGRHFVKSYQRPVPPALESWLTSREALDYAWPGNVRELQNALRNLLLGLPPQLGAGSGNGGLAAASASGGEGIPVPVAAGEASYQEVADWYVARVVAMQDGNLTRAARVLGLDRSTVRRRLKS